MSIGQRQAMPMLIIPSHDLQAGVQISLQGFCTVVWSELRFYHL